MTDVEMARIVPGSVLVSPAGTRRMVYAVHRDRCRTYVSVPILHCSWTQRGWTILDRQMLRAYRLIRRKRSLPRTRLARRLLREVTEGTMERHCTCCEVIGVLQ